MWHSMDTLSPIIYHKYVKETCTLSTIMHRGRRNKICIKSKRWRNFYGSRIESLNHEGSLKNIWTLTKGLRGEAKKVNRLLWRKVWVMSYTCDYSASSRTHCSRKEAMMQFHVWKCLEKNDLQQGVLCCCQYVLQYFFQSRGDKKGDISNCARFLCQAYSFVNQKGEEGAGKGKRYFVVPYGRKYPEKGELSQRWLTV